MSRVRIDYPMLSFPPINLYTVWHLQTRVESPCIGRCQLESKHSWNESYCSGCGRSSTEIEHWSIYDISERRAIMDELEERKRALDLD